MLGARQVSEKGSRSIGGDITTNHDNLIKTISEPVMDIVDQAVETGTSDFATVQRQDSSIIGIYLRLVARNGLV